MINKQSVYSILRDRCWYQRPVTWAFIILLALIVLITSFASFSLQKIEREFLQKTLINIEKLRLIDEMLNLSRQRSVLLRDMIISTDPFDQDEIIQQHSALATRYLLKRNEFSVLPLSASEQERLEDIISLNSESYQLQLNIIDLAISGNREEALGLINSRLSSNRRTIFTDMGQVRKMLLLRLNESKEEVILQMSQNRSILNGLFLIAVIIGMLVVWLAYRQDARYSRRLYWQSNHDPLTRLGNRFEVECQLSAIINDNSEKDKNYALLYLDVDQFNIINNISGQAAGDELLKQLAAVLREFLGDETTICRVGGDQFVILIQNAENIEEVKKKARELLSIISRHRFEWYDRSYDVTASIGIVPVNKGRGNTEEIWSDAYFACDMAKEKGGDRVEVSLESNQEARVRREGMDWTARLRVAMEEDRLVLFRQGIRSINDGMTHSEILVRFEEKDGSIITAAKFIPAAERYNLITDIDAYVVRKTLQYMGRDTSGHQYSINLSGLSLGSHELLDMIISELEACSVDPERVCFEITETAAIRNYSEAIQFMNILHGLGCHFFLDDFGSGLSSFGYLKALPLDMIKIDAYFIRNIDDDPSNIAIINAIHTIAHGFGMKTIAEGVENEEQLSILREIGIDFVQGYLIEKPTRLMAA